MWEIYLIEQADSIKAALFALTVLTAFYAITVVLYHAINETKPTKHLKTIALPLFFLFVLLNTLTPSTRSCYMVFGLGNTIDYIKSSDEAKKLTENTLRLINSSLEKLNEKIGDKNEKN